MLIRFGFLPGGAAYVRVVGMDVDTGEQVKIHAHETETSLHNAPTSANAPACRYRAARALGFAGCRVVAYVMALDDAPIISSQIPWAGLRLRWTKEWVMLRLASVVVALVCAMGVVACGGDDDASSTAADQIHGTWHWEEQSAYTQIREDGTWSVWFNAGLVGDSHDWGTYTFDGETFVMTSAADAWCQGGAATWTVEFSDNGQESRQTFVEDSCTTPGVTRGQDLVAVRQTP